MVTRAVHLEMIDDMSSNQFLLYLHQFVAQRGIPRQILSDNAKQFKLAKRVLTKAQQEMTINDDVDDYLSKQGTQWKLIVELAPWIGGFYERLVGLTKRALRKTIGKKCLTVSQLISILIEVEGIVNSRTLVYVGDDIKLSHVLTPSDFVLANPNNIIPSYSGNKEDVNYEEIPGRSTAKRLLNVWKCGQRNLDHFWRLWRSKYLLSLKE